MLVGWFVVVGIAYMKYSSETVQTVTYIYSQILTASFSTNLHANQLLNNYVLMFGLHHMGAIVTVCILVGFLRCKCLLEV